MVYRYINELIADGKATSLHHLGSSAFAWKLADSEKLGQLSEKYPLLILGGDILSVENGQIDFTYDSWNYDGHSSSESIEVMTNYLSNYRARNGENYLFSVILGD